MILFSLLMLAQAATTSGPPGPTAGPAPRKPETSTSEPSLPGIHAKPAGAKADHPAAATVPLHENAARFEHCADTAVDAPEKAIEEANAWRIAGGDFLARQCLGLAYAQLERWPAASAAFEQAAREAEGTNPVAAANLWVQSGNAALAAAQPARARQALNAALASGLLAGEQRGEAHLDRARALVALGDNKGARADLDRALEFVPNDPLTWLLSATLARRMDDLDRAQADIGEAAKRSPDDASVAYEAGVIAMQSGSTEAARVAWKGAIATQPGSAGAKAAEAALAQLDAPETAAKTPKP